MKSGQTFLSNMEQYWAELTGIESRLAWLQAKESTMEEVFARICSYFPYRSLHPTAQLNWKIFTLAIYITTNTYGIFQYTEDDKGSIGRLLVEENPFIDHSYTVTNQSITTTYSQLCYNLFVDVLQNVYMTVRYRLSDDKDYSLASLSELMQEVLLKVTASWQTPVPLKILDRCAEHLPIDEKSLVRSIQQKALQSLVCDGTDLCGLPTRIVGIKPIMPNSQLSLANVTFVGDLPATEKHGCDCFELGEGQAFTIFSRNSFLGNLTWDASLTDPI